MRENTWMGLGVTDNLTMPIDMLAYVAWMGNNSDNAILLIADELSAKYNDLQHANLAGDYAEKALSAMINLLGLNNLKTMRWAEVTNESRYHRLHSAIATEDSLLTAMTKALPKALCKKAVGSQNLEQKKQLIGYPVEESAVTLLMNERGYPVKVGHRGEKRYDNATTTAWAILERLALERTASPRYVYLAGGYTIPTATLLTSQYVMIGIELVNKGKQIAPYATWKPGEMVLVNDSLPTVKHKLKHVDGDDNYRSWCNNLLKLVGCNDGSALEESIYNNIILPIQDRIK